MARCKTCKYFRTDNDCDGPAIEWCALEIVDTGYYVSDYPACDHYVEAPAEYDWDD